MLSIVAVDDRLEHADDLLLARGGDVELGPHVGETPIDMVAKIDKVLAHYAAKPKAVATNKAIEYTNVILKGLGHHHFAYVVGGDNGFGLKPEPGMLVHVMEQLGVQKDRTVLIGDSTNDINGGHNAGIRVCAVGYGMGNRQKMAACQPDWFIERPEELMELFI